MKAIPWGVHFEAFGFKPVVIGAIRAFPHENPVCARLATHFHLRGQAVPHARGHGICGVAWRYRFNQGAVFDDGGDRRHAIKDARPRIAGNRLVDALPLDFIPTILILTPVLMPLVRELFIMNNSIGLITPPVGTVLNVASAVAGVDLGRVTRAVVPFLVSQLVVLLLLVLWPWLVTGPLHWLR